MYGGPIGTHQRSFEWYYLRPPTASPSQKLGVRNPHSKLQSKIAGKRVHMDKNSLYGRHIWFFFWGDRESGHSQGPPQVFGYPLLTQERAKLRTWNLAGTFIREEERGHISRDCRNFWVSPIIPGTGKATDFKFCTHIHRVNQNKSPWKILLKSSRRHSQGVPKIFRAPIYGAHCAVIFAVAQLSCIIRPSVG